MKKLLQGWSASVLALLVVLAACGETPITDICDPSDPTCNPTDTTTATPPLEVIGIDPADGATDVVLDRPITVTFNRAVDPATVSATSLQVSNGAGDRSATGSTVTYTPTTSYDEGTTVLVVIGGVTDAAGVGMNGSFNSSFVTETLALMADAGPDFDVSADSLVTLDKGSTIGTGATFTWTQIAGPSVGLLVGDQPSFAAPSEIGFLSFELSGTDGTDTQVDTVDVRVLEDADRAVWVSANTGSASGDGSRQAPFASIQAGIDAADVGGNGADVYVAAGNYDESLDLRSRVSVYGGWEDTGWTRDVATHRPVVSGSATAMSGVQVNDITVEGLEVIAANAAGGNGLFVRGRLARPYRRRAPGAQHLPLRGRHRGSAGTDGVDGAQGASGKKGGDAYLCVLGGASGGAGAADPLTRTVAGAVTAPSATGRTARRRPPSRAAAKAEPVEPVEARG